MKPAHVENWVAGELEALRKIGIHQAHLCIFKNLLGIRQKDHADKVHPILYIFNAVHFTHGLSSDEWSNVTKIIMEYEKRHKLWDNPK